MDFTFWDFSSTEALLYRPDTLRCSVPLVSFVESRSETDPKYGSMISAEVLDLSQSEMYDRVEPFG